MWRIKLYEWNWNSYSVRRRGFAYWEFGYPGLSVSDSTGDVLRDSYDNGVEMLKHDWVALCRGHLHCILCRTKEGDGKRFRRGIAPHLIESVSADFECPQGFKWGEKIEPEVGFVFQGTFLSGQLSEQSIPPMLTKEDIDRTRQRFEICKTCDKSTEGGHKCSLHKSCCFGAWRSRLESKCYEGKW